jgi:RNA recognition motif-containing protein
MPKGGKKPNRERKNMFGTRPSRGQQNDVETRDNPNKAPRRAKSAAGSTSLGAFPTNHKPDVQEGLAGPGDSAERVEETAPPQKLSSRLCIKNVPIHVTEHRLKQLFEARGNVVTDVKIMRLKDGRSRKFAFVGFRDPEVSPLTSPQFT